MIEKFNKEPEFTRPEKIIDRENEYHKKRYSRPMSPSRHDAFVLGDQTPDIGVMTYADTLRSQQLDREKDNTLKNIAHLKKGDKMDIDNEHSVHIASDKKRNRWDKTKTDEKQY